VLTLNKPITELGAADSDFTFRADANILETDSIEIYPGDLQKIAIHLNSKIVYGQTITVSYSGNSVFSNEQILENFSDKPVKNNLPRRFVIPALIQAEDFYVNFGFQMEDCTDTGGGMNVGFANNGDYLDYNINIPEAGEYTFKFRVASLYSNGSVSVRLGSGNTFTPIQTVNFSATGGWQSWKTQVFKMNLPQGDYTLRLFSLSGEYNINWFEISLPTGINEIPQLKRFRIFPNPSNSSFLVEAEFSSKTNVAITLCDLTGNRMINHSIERISSFSERIDHAAYGPGIYFLTLSSEMGCITRKVVFN
jgi:hypothetical protein